MARLRTRFGIAVVALVGCSIAAVTSSSASGFYRYKRVNGQWIEGQFAYEPRAARPARWTPRASDRRSIRRPATARLERRVPTALVTGSLKPIAALRASRAPAMTTPLAAPVEPTSAHASLPAEMRGALDARAPDSNEGLSPLRAALERRAAERAIELAAAERQPVASPRTADPVSVSLDFQSGLKTTRFANGEVSAEPFDPASLRALVASPPIRRD